MGESRTELLAWLNDLLQLGYTKVEQCGSGAAYCQILDSIFRDVRIRLLIFISFQFAFQLFLCCAGGTLFSYSLPSLFILLNRPPSPKSNSMLDMNTNTYKTTKSCKPFSINTRLRITFPLSAWRNVKCKITWNSYNGWKSGYIIYHSYHSHSLPLRSNSSHSNV